MTRNMPSKEVLDKIKNDIQTNDVVLYMKGSSHVPQCGFSAVVIQILNKLNVVLKFLNNSLISL